MKTRISQRDLAKLAGVSAMTVSLALRGHPSIPEPTRLRIADFARNHGYHPDPALAALNAYRVQSAKKTFQGTLAWLTSFDEPGSWRTMKQAEGYFNGVQQRAAELGYRVDEFWATEPGLRGSRLTGILRARGIRGLIVAPLPRPRMSIPLDWSSFSSIALGYSLSQPRLHVVMNHQFRNMQQLVVQLHALGYRRIGLALPAESDERIGHAYLGGYLAGLRSLSRACPTLPVFEDEPFAATSFRSWFHKVRPDVVIASQLWLGNIQRWFLEEGLRVPRDIGLVTPCTPYGSNSIGGMDEDAQAVGRLAADTVVEMLHRNEKGIPKRPFSLLIDAAWIPGRTVRKQTIV